MPSFLAYFKVKNPKFEPFLRASEVLGDLRSRKEKTITTPPLLGQKKVMMNFL
jgi:hypothetical protein